MKKTKHVLIFVVASVLSFAVQAIDMMDTYSLALSQDPSLQLARQNQLGEQQTAEQGKALLRPSLMARARVGEARYKSDAPDYTSALEDFPTVASCAGNLAGCLNDLGRRIDSLSNAEGIDSDYQATEFNLSLTQPVYDKERWHQYKKAQLLSKRGEILYRQAQADLIYRTTETYLTALQALSSLQYDRAEQIALDRQLNFAQAQLQIGVGRASDLYELHTVNQLKASQTQMLQTTLNAALAELSGLTGRTIDKNDIKRFNAAIPIGPLVPQEKAAWIAMSRKFNLQMMNAGIDIRLADEEYKMRKGLRWPKINFVASYNRTDNSGGQGFVPGAEITAYGLDISAPLYQGGALSASEKKARYQHEAAKQQMRQQQLRLEVTVNAIYDQIDGNIKAFKILKNTLVSSLSAQKKLDQAASQGIVSVAEVLRSRKNISEIRAKIETLRYEHLVNKLKLRQMVGILDERDLKAINSLTL